MCGWLATRHTVARACPGGGLSALRPGRATVGGWCGLSDEQGGCRVACGGGGAPHAPAWVADRFTGRQEAAPARSTGPHGMASGTAAERDARGAFST